MLNYQNVSKIVLYILTRKQQFHFGEHVYKDLTRAWWWVVSPANTWGWLCCCFCSQLKSSRFKMEDGQKMQAVDENGHWKEAIERGVNDSAGNSRRFSWMAVWVWPARRAVIRERLSRSTTSGSVPGPGEEKRKYFLSSLMLAWCCWLYR